MVRTKHGLVNFQFESVFCQTINIGLDIVVRLDCSPTLYVMALR